MNVRLLPAVAVLLLHAVSLPAAPGRLYFPDDPIAVDPETQDASRVQPWNVNGPYDFLENSFFQDADKRDVRALNVNTVDEVPDSSWFTNRAVVHAVTPADIARSPHAGPADGPLTIISAKTEGRSPGFVVRDASEEVYFLKFDPPSNPEMASGAEVISTRLLHALGYHVPDNSLAVLDRADLVIDPAATTRGPSGNTRPFTTGDLDNVLARAARNADGTYRVLASRKLPGVDLGPFRYAGTRPDDPNDIYPHEHRRELRGLRVAAAWLNHDDSRSLNTRDTLVERHGRRVVWHHLLDFGSTLGSGTTQSQSPRAGNEYLWETRPTLLTMLTLGFYVRPWIKVEYPDDLPSVGRFEADFFQPQLWRPDYPNPAFDNARGDDAFWAARRVAAIGDEAIAAVVKSAAYSDPRAVSYLVRVLIERRDKIAARWLNGVLPLVDCSLGGGVLTCRNEAIDRGVASVPGSYQTRWFELDNERGTTRAAGDVQVTHEPRIPAPPDLLQHAEYTVARITADHPAQPGWARPLSLTFRREGRSWRLVGVTRT